MTFTEVVLTARKHSNVCYIHRKDIGFEAVKKAKSISNSLGLDLFEHNGFVYEGRSGVRLANEKDMPGIEQRIESSGGIVRIMANIETEIAKTGESPRYTRPNERKKDAFPPDPRRENIVFAKDSYGKKHYYYRFEHDSVELFTLNSQKGQFRQVFVQCEGYMLGIGQHHTLEDITKRLKGLENGVKGEVERLFNESIADPDRWADSGFANILGRTDEATTHNAPIREARRLDNEQRDAEYESKRIAEEQAVKAEYEKAIITAENALMDKKEVKNTELHSGKSLIMQLFREHESAVPLKTQGWIINSLCALFYNNDKDSWSYRYNGNPSTVFFDYLKRLLAAVQTKQQYEELNQSSDCEQFPDRYMEAENDDDMEI